MEFNQHCNIVLYVMENKPNTPIKAACALSSECTLAFSIWFLVCCPLARQQPRVSSSSHEDPNLPSKLSLSPLFAKAFPVHLSNRCLSSSLLLLELNIRDSVIYFLFLIKI